MANTRFVQRRLWSVPCRFQKLINASLIFSTTGCENFPYRFSNVCLYSVDADHAVACTRSAGLFAISATSIDDTRYVCLSLENDGGMK